MKEAVMDDNLPISVSCASDENYYCGLLVTLHSLCIHAAHGLRLKIHVLDTGLKAASRNDLAKRLSEIPGRSIDIQFHDYDTALFSSCPKWRGGYSAYARLALQDILADEDWTIYTDIDTLWLRDVGELWAERERVSVLAAVPDGSACADLSSGSHIAELFASRGRQIDPARYFCSGLMLMNLAELRKRDFLAECAKFQDSNSDLLDFPDQNLYNWILPYPDTMMLDWRWGEFAVAYGRREMTSPRVVHFAKAAPWNRRITAVGMLWWEYLHKNIKNSRFSRKAAFNCFVFRCLKVPFVFYCAYGFFWIFNRRYFKKRKSELF